MKPIQRREFLKSNVLVAASLAIGTGASVATCACTSNKDKPQPLDLREIREREHNIEEMVFASRKLRKIISSDPHRPAFHITNPEGFHNDVNGLQFWKGRYHLFYLGRTLIPDIPDRPESDDWIGRVWQHVSSHDLIHWIHHSAALEAPSNGSTNRGPQSGGAIANAPIPTLIYHWGGHGTYIATSDDDCLIHWTPSLANPVIPVAGGDKEYIVFDPCAWYDKNLKTYYALIGNKNRRNGFEGDCTSLFRSPDLVNWKYIGPFYKSKREWTDEEEDAACPDFFPLGNKFMLLMHGHRPFPNCHYYLGKFENEKFYPEIHGRMTWPGGQLAGPETFLDNNGRRIFFGWIPEAQGRDWKKLGWASVISLPRVLSLADDGQLIIEPAVELQSLRSNHKHKGSFQLNPDTELILEDIKGDTMEIEIEIEPNDAKEFGIKVRCSEDGEENTPIMFVPFKEVLRIELNMSSVDKSISYSMRQGDSTININTQEAPLKLSSGENLKLRIFMDRSVLEVFANRRQCLTQRIYPMKPDSMGIKLATLGGSIRVKSLDSWDIIPTAW